MRPHRAICRALTVTLGLAVAGIGLATPAAAHDQGRKGVTGSVVSIFGEAGDPVTGGESQVWRTGRDAVTMTTSPTRDAVRVLARAPGGEQYDFRFQTRAGEDFTFGESDTAATSTPEHGALSIVGGGRSCAGGQTGHFTVLDVTPSLSRVWLLFEQRCAGSAGSSFGEIRINEDSDPALLIAPTRVEFPNKPYGSDGGTVPITLVNTGSKAIALQRAQIVGRSTRTTATPLIDDNFAANGLLAFGVSGNTCGALAPGESCVVLVTYRTLILGPVEAYLDVIDAGGGQHRMSLAAYTDLPAEPKPAQQG
ncbi:MAG TPA: hypothetical protein VMZ00_08750 [Sporichthya sp.]|nr:hypothetical protein [Sporichthya sp.]